ncbi:MAG: hypothetical protein JNN07_08760 [Verrucomicrobiales bacterium]|nr:hypothetical protein [Verrucomicrobiales bacterium]
MVVVGIGAVLLSLAVPAFVTRYSQQSMQRAVSDITQLLWRARADAILQGNPTVVEIRPGERTFTVSTLATRKVSADGEAEGARPSERTDGSGKDDERRKTLDPAIQIELLGIEGEDWAQEEVATIRFFPNGTCDELSLVLINPNQERRNIWLEVVTGLADVESDPRKFHLISEGP